MYCPKCAHEQSCPCASCQARTPTEKPWVHSPENEDLISCGNCGMTQHCDWWQDLEMDVYPPKEIVK